MGRATTHERRRSTRGALALLVATAAVLVLAAPVDAVDSLYLDQPVVSVGADQGSATIQVAWSGAVPGQLVIISICKRSIGDAAFRASWDCSMIGRLDVNGTGDGAGSSPLEVFRGQDPTGERWGCYAPDDTPPAGVEKHTTCFVRVTDTVVSNNDADVEAPLRFEGPGRVDPGAGEDSGGAAAPAPTLPRVEATTAEAPTVTSPTGDPAPGESIMVPRGPGGEAVSITG
jgi:hypothetical protein